MIQDLKYLLYDLKGRLISNRALTTGKTEIPWKRGPFVEIKSLYVIIAEEKNKKS